VGDVVVTEPLRYQYSVARLSVEDLIVRSLVSKQREATSSCQRAPKSSSWELLMLPCGLSEDTSARCTEGGKVVRQTMGTGVVGRTVRRPLGVSLSRVSRDWARGMAVDLGRTHRGCQ